MEIESVESIIMNQKQKDEREREKGDVGRCTKQFVHERMQRNVNTMERMAKLDRKKLLLHHSKRLKE